MPPFRPRPPSDRQPGIRQANDRQRSFGFNPRQQQRPGGFQPRMTPPQWEEQLVDHLCKVKQEDH